MNYTVYLHRNLKNQKVYIGQTCQPVQKRQNNGKFYNISIGNISSVLSGKRKTAGGYHWKRIENL